MIEKVCDIKMAVRQIACKILRKIFYGNRSKSFLRTMLGKMSTCSMIGKEEVLNFLQEVYTASIVDNQPDDADLALILSEVSFLLSNENTRIKIRAIECLVRISQATDLE